MLDTDPSPMPDAFRSHLIALISAYQLSPSSGVSVPRYDGQRDWQTETILGCLSEFARRMWLAEEMISRLKKQQRKAGRRARKCGIDASAGNGAILDNDASLGNNANETGGAESHLANDWFSTLDTEEDYDDGEDVIELRDTPRHEYEPSLIKAAITNDEHRDNSFGLYFTGVSLRDVNRDRDNLSINKPSSPSPLSTKTASTATTTAAGSSQVSCPTCGRFWSYSVSTAITPTASNGSAVTEADGSSLVTPKVLPSDSGLCVEEENIWLRALVVDAARVCNAVSKGDLNQKITAPSQGSAMTNLKDIINEMVDKLGQFSDEVTRVSQEVGTEGKLGGQAVVMDAEGTWRQLTGVVNNLAANLTTQVRSIAEVTKAVALGDLSKQIEVEARGEILDLKLTVNGMIIKLRALAAEVTRVALEVGSQGKLGGQVVVPDVEGVWFELVRSVNRMCSSLTDQVRSIALVTTAVAQGDLTQKIEIQVEGEMLTLKGTVNFMVDQLSAFASEVTRVALEIGTFGILGGQATVEGVQGTWADLRRNVFKMASNVTAQVRSISEVIQAVATGDLTKLVDIDVQGEMLDLKLTVNSMVAQLSTITNEVARVSLEVSTEGILGGQAYVPDAQGMWQVLTANFNLMALDFTNQVRSMAAVTKAVTHGDLTKKIKANVRGEVLELNEAVNDMTESLNLFANEVTRVAREVGTEGKLGGQARVTAGGTWKDLAENVNVMAANLTIKSLDRGTAAKTPEPLVRAHL